MRERAEINKCASRGSSLADRVGAANCRSRESLISSVVVVERVSALRKLEVAHFAFHITAPRDWSLQVRMRSDIDFLSVQLVTAQTNRIQP